MNEESSANGLKEEINKLTDINEMLEKELAKTKHMQNKGNRYRYESDNDKKETNEINQRVCYKFASGNSCEYKENCRFKHIRYVHFMHEQDNVEITTSANFHMIQAKFAEKI